MAEKCKLWKCTATAVGIVTVVNPNPLAPFHTVDSGEHSYCKKHLEPMGEQFQSMADSNPTENILVNVRTYADVANGGLF